MVDLSKDKIDRLIFSRYLLREAEIQKRKGRPFSSSSILLLYDSVECFLQIALEVYFLSERKAKLVRKMKENMMKQGLLPHIVKEYLEQTGELQRRRFEAKRHKLSQGEQDKLELMILQGELLMMVMDRCVGCEIELVLEKGVGKC